MSLNGMDFAILAVILISMIISLFRGIVREALSLVFWVVAFWVGFNFSDSVANLLTAYVPSHTLRTIAGFLILFILSLIVGGIISSVIANIIERTGLGSMDRLLGMLFGAGRGVILVAVFLLLGSLLLLSEQPFWKESVLVPQFKPLIVWLQGFLPSDFTQTVNTQPVK